MPKGGKKTVTGLKMAKASKEDIDSAMRLLAILQAIEENEFFPDLKPGDDISEAEPEDFDCDDRHHLRTFYEQVKECARRPAACLMRVIWGFDTLASTHNSIIDPDCDVLELHPRIVRALETQERIDKPKKRHGQKQD